MPTRTLIGSFLLLLTSIPAAGQDDAARLAGQLSETYKAWRQAVIRSDARQWQALTASHRKVEVRNRLVSERLPFPAAVFRLPAPPPDLDAGLKLINVSKRGATAKIAYFGKIDFGVGGAPTENILVLSFVAESGRWKYDRADFVNLTALPDVRKEVAAGDLSYVEATPEFQATGTVPPTPIPVPQAKYIAKVYVFCPGREVEAQVNGISRHRFANAKEAEVVLGGARDGRNDIFFRVKPLEGGTGKEAFTIRVYLMSEIPGTKPIKAFQYQVEEGGEVKPFGKETFDLNPETAAKLR